MGGMSGYECASCGQQLPKCHPIALYRQYMDVCDADDTGFEQAFGVSPPFGIDAWCAMRASKIEHERGMASVFGKGRA